MLNRRRIGIISQPVNNEQQILLDIKIANQKLAGKNFLDNAKYAMSVVRKARYIDNMILKKNYLANRESYHQKMNNAFASRAGNTSIEAFNNLFSAVEFNDTSTLWERKASLAKGINDNKIDVMGALIGAVSSYISSVGVMIPMALTFYEIGVRAFSDFLFLGFLGILLFGLYEGYFSQCRLKRLVKEHKDYSCEFDEVTNLLERKKDLRILKTGFFYP
jgi:hypothetical protein